MKNHFVTIARIFVGALMILGISTSGRSQSIDELKLKDYRPVSIFRVPVSDVQRARFPVIDVHTHDYARTDADLDEWVRKMDTLGIRKTIILSGRTGQAFDEIVKRYSRYPDRFDVWCGFDFSDFEKPGWIDRAIRELERCKEMGAKGVGEISDKGRGVVFSRKGSADAMHIDDPRITPLLRKCGELGMPVNVHVADPIWAYLPIDSLNDGLVSASRWRIDMKPGMLDHPQLLATLENAAGNSPGTTFIACHLANCDFDLERLGSLFDRYPNLYADISARYYQTASIPRRVKAFYTRYGDRLLYGTDMSTDIRMYRFTFRVLQTADEHFYFRYTYHWPLYGLDLSDDVLRKIYHDNASRLLND